MQMTVHSTDRIIEVGGIKGRIWEGTTAKGVSVHCIIVQVACHKDSDNSEMERDLLEHTAASADAIRAFDPRFIL